MLPYTSILILYTYIFSVREKHCGDVQPATVTLHLEITEDP